MSTLTLSERAFSALVADDCGVCLACHDTTTAPVEPDAEEYRCDACGLHAVMGAESALVSGYVEFSEGPV